MTIPVFDFANIATYSKILGPDGQGYEPDSILDFLE